MPVDFSQMAAALSRALRANQAEGDAQTQLQQQQQQLELQKQRQAQDDALYGRQQKLSEELAAPTLDSWKAIQDYANTLPPDQRAKLMMGVAAPSAAKLQSQTAQVEQERQGALASLSGMMANAKPDDARVYAALMSEIATAPDLVTLRQAVNRANGVLSGSTKPPPLRILPVAGGAVPLVGSSGGWSPGFGVGGSGGGSSGSGAPGGVSGPAMSIPGVSGSAGAPFIRKPTTAETTEADSIQQALDQIEALKPEIDAYAKSSPPETGVLNSLGGMAKRYGEYGAYKLGAKTPNSKFMTDASQLYAQIAGSLTRMGPRSIRYLQQLSPHIPHATDSPELMQEKIGQWEQILRRAQADIAKGPFAAGAGGEEAPAGGGSSSPSASRPEALAPDPKAVKQTPKGLNYYTDSSGRTMVLDPDTGRWGPL